LEIAIGIEQLGCLKYRYRGRTWPDISVKNRNRDRYRNRTTAFL